MRILTTLFYLTIILTSCKTTYYVTDTNLTYERVSDLENEGDPELLGIIAPYQKELGAVMNEVIGHLDVPLLKERPESNMGNWLADMLYVEAKELNSGILDFAVQNYGGLRVPSMSEGPVTIGEIYEVMPFDNLISIISADGRGTKEFLDHIAQDKGWPISKGLSFKIKDGKAIEIMLHGKPLDDDRIYHFALPDYIAGGGSGSNMLKNFTRKDVDVLIRDAFINHIKKDTQAGERQSPLKEGRIINLDHE